MLVLVLALAGVAVVVPFAGAATPAFVNACADDLDPGVCERVDYVAAQVDDDNHRLDAVWNGVWALVGLALVGLVAPIWVRNFRSLRE